MTAFVGTESNGEGDCIFMIQIENNALNRKLEIFQIILLQIPKDLMKGSDKRCKEDSEMAIFDTYRPKLYKILPRRPPYNYEASLRFCCYIID